MKGAQGGRLQSSHTGQHPVGPAAGGAGGVGRAHSPGAREALGLWALVVLPRRGVGFKVFVLRREPEAGPTDFKATGICFVESGRAGDIARGAVALHLGRVEEASGILPPEMLSEKQVRNVSWAVGSEELLRRP